MKNLSHEELSHLRMACVHLARCWDELREVEKSRDCEVSVNDIFGLAALLPKRPDFDASVLTDEVIQGFWNGEAFQL